MINDFFNNALSTLNSLTDMIDRFDFDAAMNNFSRKSNKFLEDVNHYVNNVKDNLSDLKVSVAYDKENDVVSWEINDDVLTIKVTANDGSTHSVMNTTIPENANVEKMYKKYDKDKHILTFIIPKEKSIEALKNEKIDKLVGEYRDKILNLRDQLKNDIDIIKSSHSFEQLENAKPSNKTKSDEEETKQGRDSKGRFVAKVKNGKAKVEEE